MNPDAFWVAENVLDPIPHGALLGGPSGFSLPPLHLHQPPQWYLLIPWHLPRVLPHHLYLKLHVAALCFCSAPWTAGQLTFFKFSSNMWIGVYYYYYCQPWLEISAIHILFQAQKYLFIYPSIHFFLVFPLLSCKNFPLKILLIYMRGKERAQPRKA